MPGWLELRAHASRDYVTGHTMVVLDAPHRYAQHVNTLQNKA